MIPYSVDELIAVCIARQVKDHQVWAQGINTPLVMTGLLLAKYTHAPAVRFVSAIGQGIVQDRTRLYLTKAESVWLDHALMNAGFAQGAADLLPAYQPHEFFRPAQIDIAGNTNNIAFGKNYAKPRLRLPGSGGIPDVTVQYDHIYYYVPRHMRVTFCEQVDFVSGLGYSDGRQLGSGPRYLISDLGQFDWVDGRMRVMSLHEGVTLTDVQRKTGFELITGSIIPITIPPTREELELIRREIDPLNIRKLEFLSGSNRRQLLKEIIAEERRSG